VPGSTARQRIADALREASATPGALSTAVGVPTDAVYDHVRHLARSLEGTDERLLVAPPACRDCGFDGFDDPLNRPSRCPDCRSERVAEPTFVVE